MDFATRHKVHGTINVQVSGCGWYESYEQLGLRGDYVVPAQILDIQVVDVMDESGRLRQIGDGIGFSPETRDLRDVEDEEQVVENEQDIAATD